MTRLYENRNIWPRNAALTAVVVVATLWGVWELWHAAHDGDATTGSMFGVLFIGGGIYAFYQLLSEQRGMVARLDRDASGALTATVWRLQGPLAVPGPITNWRPHVETSGRTRTVFLYADSPAFAKPLRFDLKGKVDLAGLRSIAPAAIAEYETLTGKAANTS